MTIILGSASTPVPRLTALQIVQEFCKRTGLGVPSSITEANPTVTQFVALLNEELDEIKNEYDWQEMVGATSFLTLAGSDQGSLDSLAGTPVNYILNDSIWNMSSRLSFYGSLNAQTWAAIQALTPVGPQWGLRVMNNHLFVTPDVVTPFTAAFSYQRAYPVNVNGDETVGSNFFANNNDTCVFSDEHMIAALRWRYKREKGLTYTEDKARYNSIVSNKKIRNRPRDRLSMDGGCRDARPQIVVPGGNWLVP